MAFLMSKSRAVKIPSCLSRLMLPHVPSKNKPANFAVLLWHSVGTPSIILREVTAVYGFLCPPTLTMDKANRVCNAIALFQYVASDALTRPQFLKARMVYYLFPFIMLAENNKPYEYLRLSSLGVVGALLKSEDPEVVPHLLEIEGFPFFLHALEAGSQLSKTVAVFIIHKILMDDLGLHYCCGVAERFFTIARAFQRVVEKLVAEMIERLPNEASLKLLKNMIRCYLRMCECPRVRDGLSICLPSCFKNDAISYVLHEDPIALGWVQQILFNVTSAERVRAQAAAEASERALRINLENLNIRG
ncbi:hypothetical protein Ancab_025077 [Ancistrocladus abbreviatus]